MSFIPIVNNTFKYECQICLTNYTSIHCNKGTYICEYCMLNWLTTRLNNRKQNKLPINKKRLTFCPCNFFHYLSLDHISQYYNKNILNIYKELFLYDCNDYLKDIILSNMDDHNNYKMILNSEREQIFDSLKKDKNCKCNKCPNCSEIVILTGGDDSVFCPYCDTLFNIKTLEISNIPTKFEEKNKKNLDKINENTLYNLLKNEFRENHIKKCPNCKVLNIWDCGSEEMKCPYCNILYNFKTLEISNNKENLSNIKINNNENKLKKINEEEKIKSNNNINIDKLKQIVEKDKIKSNDNINIDDLKQIFGNNKVKKCPNCNIINIMGLDDKVCCCPYCGINYNFKTLEIYNINELKQIFGDNKVKKCPHCNIINVRGLNDKVVNRCPYCENIKF